MKDQFRLMASEIIEGKTATNQIDDIQTSSIRQIRRLVKAYQNDLGARYKVFAERMIYDKFGNLEQVILLEDPWEHLKHGTFGRAN